MYSTHRATGLGVAISRRSPLSKYRRKRAYELHCYIRMYLFVCENEKYFNYV